MIAPSANYIDGHFVESHSTRVTQVIDPATQDVAASPWGLPGRRGLPRRAGILPVRSWAPALLILPGKTPALRAYQRSGRGRKWRGGDQARQVQETARLMAGPTSRWNCC